MDAPHPALRVASATDTGRVRDHNEDAALVDGLLFVVADGMGGHQAGEVASRIAVDTLRDVAGRADLSPDDLVEQVEAANQAILDSAVQHPERTGMATTLAGLALLRLEGAYRWVVVNVGDSRVYRLLDGRLRSAFSMTTFPTVLATMLRTSRIGTPDRMSDANVRVNRARQILWAITPKIGIVMRFESQNQRPGGVLMK